MFPFLPVVSLLAPFCIPLVYFLVDFESFFLSIFCFLPIKKNVIDLLKSSPERNKMLCPLFTFIAHSWKSCA